MQSSLEFPTTAVLETERPSQPLELGGPVTCRFEAVKGVKYTLLPAKDPNRELHFTSRALAGIYEEKYGDADYVRVWLVFSWLVRASDHEPITDYAIHNRTLVAHEPAFGDSSLRWFADVSATLRWSAITTVPPSLGARFHLPKKAMANLASAFGNPDTNGLWLFKRLLPRRIPAAVRQISPVEMQFFTPLT